MSHPLDSARERLKRAQENIRNLNSEIAPLISSLPVITFGIDGNNDPVFTDNDRIAFEEIKEFIKTKTVEPRFAVLAGEIIHHMRAAFDHLAWQLSSADFQTKFPDRIEFPVIAGRNECGITKDKIHRYCRKVEGISSPTALTRIQGLQPPAGDNRFHHPLFLIHEMDRFDKHRYLMLAIFMMRFNLRGVAQRPAIVSHFPWETRARTIKFTGPVKVDMKGTMSAQLAFENDRWRDSEPLIPTLQNLLGFTIDTIESFAEEFLVVS